eukprot:TRINITY_DN13937_c0_g1_i1.p1 TRINITY_DN13937_c0_g1~~TRINITY_DN13937_c0_g1_i1.p1  ORF type:complete len:484 (+),score=68.81 TRINITY_DN13937_c0_g1_i1:30-1481(+)
MCIRDRKKKQNESMTSTSRLLVGLGAAQMLLGILVSNIPEQNWLIYRYCIAAHHEFCLNGLLLMMIGWFYPELQFKSAFTSRLFVLLANLGTWSNGSAFLFAGLLTGGVTELAPGVNFQDEKHAEHQLGELATFILMFICGPTILIVLIWSSLSLFIRSVTAKNGRSIDYLLMSFGIFQILIGCLIGLLPPNIWAVSRFAIAAHTSLCYGGNLLIALGIIYPACGFVTSYQKVMVALCALIGTWAHGLSWCLIAWTGELTPIGQTLVEQATIIQRTARIEKLIRKIAAQFEGVTTAMLLFFTAAPTLIFGFGTILLQLLIVEKTTKESATTRLIMIVGLLELTLACFTPLVGHEFFTYYRYSSYGHVALTACGMTLLALAPIADEANFSPFFKHLFGLSSVVANVFYPAALLYGAFVGSTSHWTPHVNRQTQMTPPENEAFIFNVFFVGSFAASYVSLALAIVGIWSSKGSQAASTSGKKKTQ